MTTAWLEDGQLYIHRENGKPVKRSSPFADDLVERRQDDQQRHGWKRGGAWSGNPYGDLLNGGEVEPVGQLPVRFLALSITGDEMHYALQAATMRGVFRRDVSGDDELRLMHRPELMVGDLDRHPRTGRLAAAILNPGGGVDLHASDEDGYKLRQVTEGDSADEAPTWSRAEPDRDVLVYASSGLGRDSTGYVVAHGPSRVERLDLGNGDLATLREDDTFDYLLPRELDDGSLLVVRRPYEDTRRGAGPLATIKAAAMVPVRLGQTVWGIGNALSMMFNQKPLYQADSAGGRRPVEVPRALVLRNQLVRNDRLAKQAADGEPRPLVGRDWELVRVRDGAEEVVTAGVLHYDVGGDGRIVHTDGSSIRETTGGRTRTLATGKLVTCVACS